VGSARTALFNWLFVRQFDDGVFILRIEDTDADRNREEWVDGILDALSWLGFNVDEGPFRQSDNALVHSKSVEQLLAGGSSTTATARVRRSRIARARTRRPATTGSAATGASSVGPTRDFASVRPTTG